MALCQQVAAQQYRIYRSRFSDPGSWRRDDPNPGKVEHKKLERRDFSNLVFLLGASSGRNQKTARNVLTTYDDGYTVITGKPPLAPSRLISTTSKRLWNRETVAEDSDESEYSDESTETPESAEEPKKRETYLEPSGYLGGNEGRNLENWQKENGVHGGVFPDGYDGLSAIPRTLVHENFSPVPMKRNSPGIEPTDLHSPLSGDFSAVDEFLERGSRHTEHNLGIPTTTTTTTTTSTEATTTKNQHSEEANEESKELDSINFKKPRSTHYAQPQTVDNQADQSLNTKLYCVPCETANKPAPQPINKNLPVVEPLPSIEQPYSPPKITISTGSPTYENINPEPVATAPTVEVPPALSPSSAPPPASAPYIPPVPTVDISPSISPVPQIPKEGPGPDPAPYGSPDNSEFPLSPPPPSPSMETQPPAPPTASITSAPYAPASAPPSTPSSPSSSAELPLPPSPPPTPAEFSSQPPAEYGSERTIMITLPPPPSPLDPSPTPDIPAGTDLKPPASPSPPPIPDYSPSPDTPAAVDVSPPAPELPDQIEGKQSTAPPSEAYASPSISPYAYSITPPSVSSAPNQNESRSSTNIDGSSSFPSAPSLPLLEPIPPPADVSVDIPLGKSTVNNANPVQSPSSGYPDIGVSSQKPLSSDVESDGLSSLPNDVLSMASSIFMPPAPPPDPEYITNLPMGISVETQKPPTTSPSPPSIAPASLASQDMLYSVPSATTPSSAYSQITESASLSTSVDSNPSPATSTSVSFETKPTTEAKANVTVQPAVETPHVYEHVEPEHNQHESEETPYEPENPDSIPSTYGPSPQPTVHQYEITMSPPPAPPPYNPQPETAPPPPASVSSSPYNPAPQPYAPETLAATPAPPPSPPPASPAPYNPEPQPYAPSVPAPPPPPPAPYNPESQPYSPESPPATNAPVSSLSSQASPAPYNPESQPYAPENPAMTSAPIPPPSPAPYNPETQPYAPETPAMTSAPIPSPSSAPYNPPPQPYVPETTAAPYQPPLPSLPKEHTYGAQGPEPVPLPVNPSQSVAVVPESNIIENAESIDSNLSYRGQSTYNNIEEDHTETAVVEEPNNPGPYTAGATYSNIEEDYEPPAKPEAPPPPSQPSGGSSYSDLDEDHNTEIFGSKEEIESHSHEETPIEEEHENLEEDIRGEPTIENTAAQRPQPIRIQVDPATKPYRPRPTPRPFYLRPAPALNLPYQAPQQPPIPGSAYIQSLPPPPPPPPIPPPQPFGGYPRPSPQGCCGGQLFSQQGGLCMPINFNPCQQRPSCGGGCGGNSCGSGCGGGCGGGSPCGGGCGGVSSCGGCGGGSSCGGGGCSPSCCPPQTSACCNQMVSTCCQPQQMPCCNQQIQTCCPPPVQQSCCCPQPQSICRHKRSLGYAMGLCSRRRL
ncbi:unnamed protein product [Caenorhabditis bovis]|uniref:Uncharacterized protein n=1 Tax=Caenorhabditis bovis TaxID=2654633 RepID=A0A8S1FBC3_9PELO|nr:unnamed protein product [Caenorhabditis bovis]